MKKMILPLLAAATLVTTGCSNDETVEVPQGQKIGFDVPFINKTGRAYELGVNTFSRFLLWGSSSFANDYIFNGEAISVSGMDVSYTPVRYWNEGSSYHFMAFATPTEATKDAAWTFTPGAVPTEDGYFGQLTFDNSAESGADGLVDLCYAGADRTTQTPLTTDCTKPVPLAFKHVLSRLRFRFVNAFTENYFIEVKNVKISNLPLSGSLDFSQSPLAWVNTGYTYSKVLAMEPQNPPAVTIAGGEELISTNALTETMYTLPDANEFTVDFDVNLWVKTGDNYICLNGENNAYHHSVKVNAKQMVSVDGTSTEVPGLLIGTAYIFQCSINSGNIAPSELKPIDFTVSISPMNYDGLMDIEGKIISPTEEGV